MSDLYPFFWHNLCILLYAKSFLHSCSLYTTLLLLSWLISSLDHLTLYYSHGCPLLTLTSLKTWAYWQVASSELQRMRDTGGAVAVTGVHDCHHELPQSQKVEHIPSAASCLYLDKMDSHLCWDTYNRISNLFFKFVPQFFLNFVSENCMEG